MRSGRLIGKGYILRQDASLAESLISEHVDAARTFACAARNFGHGGLPLSQEPRDARSCLARPGTVSNLASGSVERQEFPRTQTMKCTKSDRRNLHAAPAPLDSRA